MKEEVTHILDSSSLADGVRVAVNEIDDCKSAKKTLKELTSFGDRTRV